jgi:PAS domain S-box-containing protein/putative nucleotidyltransferase with HDIG domain
VPPGATLTVVDGSGGLLARYPEPQRQNGKSPQDESVLRTLLATESEGTLRTRTPDGSIHFLAFAPISGGPDTGRAYIRAEFPDGRMRAWIYRISPRTLADLMLAALVLLAAMWAGGGLFALRPAGALIRAAQRLGAGDLSIRAGLSHSRGPLGQLARALDGLADALQAKQAEASRAIRTSNEIFRALVQASPLAIITLDSKGNVTMWNAGAERIFGWATHEVIGRPNPLVPADHREEFQARYARVMEGETLTEKEGSRRRKDGSLITIAGSTAPLPDADGAASGVMEVLTDLTGRKHGEELQRQLDALTTLYRSTQALSESLSLHQMARQIVRTCVDSFGARLALIVRIEPDGSERLLAHHPPDIESPHQALVQGSGGPPAPGAPGRMSDAGAPVVINDLTAVTDPPSWVPAALALGLRSVGIFPLISRTKTFGVLGLYSDQPGFFTPERAEFSQAYAHQVAAALDSARLHDDSDRRLRQLQILREIDMAISSSLDLELTLNVFLEYVGTQLPADAVDVLLLNPTTHTLDYVAGRGFRTDSLQHTHLRLGEGHAGRAARSRHVISILNLAESPGDFEQSPFLAREGFVAYHAVPLIAKGQVKGVLELFHRSQPSPPWEWRDFLHALAAKAAIAIDNAALFADLQRSNVDLALAYDTTLEGWSRALDLRDRETEGHSQRVAEMTLRLARAMGVPEADLVHIRRGALLHDIGKMGTPDSILYQPGPLSEEEWEIMRQHPVHAHDMLQPIPYLRSALVIPYCHHEKWDGTGYPRGLKEEQIPIAARIFAVVDVWDALRSDRPYRAAWTEEQVQEYIRSQAGKHFDPRVVEVFLEMGGALRVSKKARPTS